MGILLPAELWLHPQRDTARSGGGEGACGKAGGTGGSAMLE